MSNIGLFVVITACILCLSGMNNISNTFVQAQDLHTNQHSAGELLIINQDSMTQLDTSDKISFRIKGIDYSIIIAQILVTIDGKTFAQTFDPIALLDPHDDGNGLIEFDMLVPKDALKPGSSHTSCIKILEDTDNFSTNLTCQTGSIDDIHVLSGENRQIYLKI